MIEVETGRGYYRGMVWSTEAEEDSRRGGGEDRRGERCLIGAGMRAGWQGGPYSDGTVF